MYANGKPTNTHTHSHAYTHSPDKYLDRDKDGHAFDTPLSSHIPSVIHTWDDDAAQRATTVPLYVRCIRRLFDTGKHATCKHH